MTITISLMPSGEPIIDDLAGHLAYHASIGFAECRDLEPPPEPPVRSDNCTDGFDREFEVVHLGRQFIVRIDEIRGKERT